jgi:hypothetical protein
MRDTSRLGILMLDTRFPRVPGDVGNPKSFDFPVTYRTVPGATPEEIVCGDSRKWVDAFIREGQELVRSGCTGLATTCGFLTLVREEVATACGVPVASSALEQIPMIQQMLPKGSTVGILTISADSLSAAHLAAANVSQNTPVKGVDTSHFANAILGNQTHLDSHQAEAELTQAALLLCQNHPSVDAIVLECTNMPPYATAIAQATQRPVFSILTYLNWFHSALDA